MAVEIFEETLIAEVIEDDPFTSEFLETQAIAEQGVLHSDVHTDATGTLDSGPILFADTSQADNLGWVQQLGAGVYDLNTDLNGHQFGFGVDGPLVGPLHVRGRGTYLTRLSPHSVPNVPNPDWTPESPPGVPKFLTAPGAIKWNRAVWINTNGSAYDTIIEDMMVSLERALPGPDDPEPGSGQNNPNDSTTDLIGWSIESAKGVTLRNVAYDGKGTDGMPRGTAFRAQGLVSDITLDRPIAKNTRSHGVQISAGLPQGALNLPGNHPTRIRVLGSKVFNIHKSGVNVSGTEDMILMDHMGFNDILGHGSEGVGLYFSGYGGLRIGNENQYFQVGNFHVDGWWRTFRIVDTWEFLATNVMTRNSGLSGGVFTGKDSQFGGISVVGAKFVNSMQAAGHPLDFTEDEEGEPIEKEAMIAPSAAIFWSIDSGANLQRNGQDSQFVAISTSDDVRPPGLGRIITKAGEKKYWIIDNAFVGQTYAGGRRRLQWRIDQTSPNNQTDRPSIVYSKELATVLGQNRRLISQEYFSQPNGGGVRTSYVSGGVLHQDPGWSGPAIPQGGSGVTTCEFDGPCPISIGTVNLVEGVLVPDLTTGDDYKHRRVTQQPMYFGFAKGVAIHTTPGDINVTGTVEIPGPPGEPPIVEGTHFLTELKPHLTTTQVLVFARNAKRNYIGKLVEGGVTSDIAMHFVNGANPVPLEDGGTAAGEWNGPYLFAVEEKVSQSFVMTRGGTGCVFPITTQMFRGYSQAPASIHPTCLAENQFACCTLVLPPVTLTAGQSSTPIYFPLPRELFDWRGACIGYLKVQPFANIAASNGVDYLRGRIGKTRLGGTSLLTNTLPLTLNAALAGGLPIAMPIGNDGPFDVQVAANILRMGSVKHGEAPDLISFVTEAVGAGGSFPGGIVYLGLGPYWFKGV